MLQVTGLRDQGLIIIIIIIIKRRSGIILYLPRSTTGTKNKQKQRKKINY